jgi:cytochrome c biogenesis DsbD-like protein
MRATQLVLAAAIVAAAPAVSAQVRRPVPALETHVGPAHLAPGSHAHLTLKVVLPSGLHVQSDKPRDPSLIPTALTLTVPSGLSIVRTTYPKASDLPQPGREQALAVFSGTFTIDVDVAIAASLQPGTVEIPGSLRYQSCTEQVCFPPSRAAVMWRLAVNAK